MSQSNSPRPDSVSSKEDQLRFHQRCIEELFNADGTHIEQLESDINTQQQEKTRISEKNDANLGLRRILSKQAREWIKSLQENTINLEQQVAALSVEKKTLAREVQDIKQAAEQGMGTPYPSYEELNEENTRLLECIDEWRTHAESLETGRKQEVKKIQAEKGEVSRKYNTLRRNPQGQNHLLQEHVKELEAEKLRLCERLRNQERSVKGTISKLELSSSRASDSADFYKSLYHRDEQKFVVGPRKTAHQPTSLENDLEAALAEIAQLKETIQTKQIIIDGYEERYDDEYECEEEDETEVEAEKASVGETAGMAENLREESAVHKSAEVSTETAGQKPCDIVTEPEPSQAKVASEDELTDTDTEIIELKEETNRLKEEMATLKDSKALHALNKELQAKVDILQQRDQRASRNRARLLLHALKVWQDDLRDHRSKQAF